MAKYTGSVIITGGTSGLGYQAAFQIAKSHPQYLVAIASRSDKEHAAETINKTLHQSNTIFLPLDLGSNENVRAFAKQWTAVTPAHPPIKALLLNAGLQFPSTDPSYSADGLEATFAIAHVGHALLFHLLAPSLSTTGARIVLTSSGTHDPAQRTGLPAPEYITAAQLARPPAHAANNKLVNGRQRYTTAKLCNVLWTYALARRLPRHVTVTAFDPGLMPGTGLVREGNALERFLWNVVLPRLIGLLRIMLMPNVHTTAESGAALARLAVGADVEGVSGRYFEGMKEIKSSKDSCVEAKQEDLWGWTVEYLSKGDVEEKVRLEALK
ncbi:unnamed protein product [Discula destructiva]